jgi:hypothetical protein
MPLSGAPVRGDCPLLAVAALLVCCRRFFVVTGASGAGKSTVRRLIAPELGDSVQCVELGDVVDVPGVPTIAWRQWATEMVVRCALELQTDDRHLLLSGDPVAVGEVLAAPSADQLDGVAACLLDVDRAAQAVRLHSRGDDPGLLVHHVAFADWMRGHVRDASHMPEVLITNGWEKMRCCAPATITEPGALPVWGAGDDCGAAPTSGTQIRGFGSADHRRLQAAPGNDGKPQSFA